jgi:hypothetical protein
LSADQGQLLAANPKLMIELSAFAATEAGKNHEIGSAEYVEAGKRVFFENLNHLQEQARQQTAAPQAAEQTSIPDNQPKPEAAMETPPFFKPPAPKPMRPPHVPVSAPVSRTIQTSDRRPDCETGRTTLSVEEKEIARLSGVDLETYARGKLALQRRKAAGELQ